MGRRALVVVSSLACLSVLSASHNAHARTPDRTIERLMQFGLETLTTGAALTDRDGTALVSLRVLRTWRTTSGHFCRRYELTWRPRAGNPPKTGVRCREKGGGWRPVE